MMHDNNSGSNQDGFTITELLISVALGAIASVLMVTAFVFTYGSVIVQQTKASMTRDSQVFLRRMVEDIRLGNEIRQTNQLTDPSGITWTTSDPANIMVITSPATDSSNNLVYNDTTGFPYQNEVIYFSNNNKMYRRIISNPEALTSVQTSTCTAGTTGCPADIALVNNLSNMLFEFYDSDNNVTTNLPDARSVQVTINLRKKVYGEDIKTTNTTRITLRNER